MKNKILVLLAACALSLGVAGPSFAGGLGDVGSAVGATAGMIIGAPVGLVEDSCFIQPWKTSRYLATNFGDEHGWSQKLVGTLIGVPVGFVYGIPAGTILGARHGWQTGWEKPFSTESMWVYENK